MKAVAQEDPMGCGLACVACVAGVSYSEVLDKVDREHVSGRGYYCSEIVEALSEFGFSYDYSNMVPESEKHLEEEGTIVFVKRSEKYPAGHYLVKTEEGWMNPWINYPIKPAEAGFQEELPGEPEWVIFPAKPGEKDMLDDDIIREVDEELERQGYFPDREAK